MSDLKRPTPHDLEYACIADWPARRRENQGGWLQFATMGRSWRVNSVWPLQWSGDESGVERRIHACSQWAARHGVPLAFKLADGAVAPPELPTHLTRLGFAPNMETLVMARPLDAIAAPARDIARRETFSDDFLAVLRAASPSAEDFAERYDIITRMHDATLFPIAHLGGEPAAIGLGRRNGDMVGLYLMRTAPQMRRQGLARDIVRTICAWGRKHGAAAAFLQVEAENSAAVALYESEGFTERYRYRYWLKG